MDALRYGVLYLFSRRSVQDLGYVSSGSGLLGAQRIRLVVLKPELTPSSLAGFLDRNMYKKIPAAQTAGKMGVKENLNFERCLSFLNA
jgi:hypothetical protein